MRHDGRRLEENTYPTVQFCRITPIITTNSMSYLGQITIAHGIV